MFITRFAIDLGKKIMRAFCLNREGRLRGFLPTGCETELRGEGHLYASVWTSQYARSCLREGPQRDLRQAEAFQWITV